MENNKLEKLKSILELLQNDTITPQKLASIVTPLARIVKESQDSVANVSQETKDYLNKAISYIDSEHAKLLDKVSSDTESIDLKLTKKLDKSISDMRVMCEKLMMEKPKDADEELIVEKVLEKIVLPEYKETVLDDASQIKEKLETLEGEDRLDAKAIKNLPKMVQSYVGGSAGNIKDIIAGTNITIDNSIAGYPKINASGGSGSGIVETVVGGTGITVDSTDPANPVVTNSAPDQTVAITAGTNIDSVTGTYPNFTINAATQGGAYTLPTATDTVLGGIKVGTRLTITDGVLSADVQGGGASTFIDLTDTPSDYTDDAGKGVRVNATADGLEFFTLSGDTDEKVKYDAGDPTAGYVADKIVAGTGISVAEGTAGNENKLVVTNSSPDQTVAITDSGIAVVTGTYPNFNIDVPATDLSGKQDVLTFGIADTNAVKINAADVADNDYAKFTATGLEGRSYSEVLSDIGAEPADATILKDADIGVTVLAQRTFGTAANNNTGDFATALGADDNYVTDAEKVIIGNTSGTNTGDNAVNSNYSSLVSNATHTGEVTGATTLTLDKTAISNKTDTVITASDVILFGDATDSGNLKSDTVQGILDLVPSGSALWTTFTGTRASNTTITVGSDVTAIFAKGMIIKWTDTTTHVAMVSIPSTYSSPNTTITIIGDVCSATASDFKYCMLGAEMFVKNFAVAGNLGAVATNIMNTFVAMEPYRVIGADVFVGSYGTTNNTTFDINSGGTTMFTTKPTLATTVQYSPTPFTADDDKSLALGAVVTVDLDAIQTTNAQDGYIQLYIFPTRILNLS